jgi:hypothetical protein
MTRQGFFLSKFYSGVLFHRFLQYIIITNLEAQTVLGIYSFIGAAVIFTYLQSLCGLGRG